MRESATTGKTFNGLGIAPGLIEVLGKLRFAEPTPIQRQAIPAAIGGSDIVGVAQTGTGKTLAFGIPMLQRLARIKGQGLVLLPTRELALQVEKSLHAIGQPLGLKTAVLIGGQSFGPQIDAIRRNPHVIIATPGRLIDHLTRKTITLERVNTLVLDEADRMLDMGFKPQIDRIVRVVPRDRQTMLFSATLPYEIMAIASANMRQPVRIEVAPSGTTVESVTQEIFIVERTAKPELLAAVLKEHRGSTLVFTRTKFGAKKITRALKALGESAAEIHSNRSLAQRRDALEGFRSGRYRVLIATDIASRGLDVKGIETVINYDLPSQAEDYVHRIGRTGRAGMAGHAISFAMPEERNEVRSIERLIKKSIVISPPPAGFADKKIHENARTVRKAFNPPRPVYYPGRNRNRRRW